MINLPPTPNQIKRAAVITKVITELQKFTVKKKLNDALTVTNGPKLSDRLPRTLELGAKMLVYRKKDNWNGLYKIVLITENNV